MLTRGPITGYYFDDCGVMHGYMHAGTVTCEQCGSPVNGITSVDGPSADTEAGRGTFPLSDNPSGGITG